jgi:uncharacterized membrane protein SpoIIM required for sporulation
MRDMALFGALAVSVAVFVGGLAIGYSSISDTWAADSVHSWRETDLSVTASFFAILLRNASAMAFLYSGVLTFGLTSVLALTMVSAYVGATAATGINNVGAWQLFTATGSYALLEFLGCIVAATAGFYPTSALVAGLARQKEDAGSLKRYFGAIRVSARILAFGGALVVVAACIEVTLIATR